MPLMPETTPTDGTATSKADAREWNSGSSTGQKMWPNAVAGEILFTSMDHDGVKEGFANEALARLSEEVPIPIIASGGAGKMEHFRDAFVCGKADAALAASVFHFGEIQIPDLKAYLRNEGINVRI